MAEGRDGREEEERGVYGMGDRLSGFGRAKGLSGSGRGGGGAGGWGR